MNGHMGQNIIVIIVSKYSFSSLGFKRPLISILCIAWYVCNNLTPMKLPFRIPLFNNLTIYSLPIFFFNPVNNSIIRSCRSILSCFVDNVSNTICNCANFFSCNKCFGFAFSSF